MISSSSNGQIKNVIALEKKAKARKEQGLFVVEGVKMFLEAPKDQVHKVFISESFLASEENKKLLDGYGYEVVSNEVFKSMSDTQTPQGILALVKQYSYSLEQLLDRKGRAHFMILETLQDPGNLGTILRTGEGAGVTGIIMDTTTADIYSPKVIRSTMGSIYRVPFIIVSDLMETILALKRNSITIFAACLLGAESYDKKNYIEHTAFLIGNEGNGLSPCVIKLADFNIKIPMAGEVESLNAAVAASILMFETYRQRRNQ